MQIKRSSGILLHPTSLPGPYGIGSLGGEAYKFIDFLNTARQTVWQILPLGPTGYGDSPYSAFSAFAGNPMLICLERLVEAGDLDAEDLAGVSMGEGEAHFGFVHGFKGRLLHKASQRFRKQASAERRNAFDTFCAKQGYWLDDYALFQALRRHFADKPWYDWPQEIRLRKPSAVTEWKERLEEAVCYHRYVQFVFFDQWLALKDYANSRDIKIMGDLPIFVALDSADVWANPGQFRLDEQGRPTHVAGVPPDYFSSTGQRWGNPLYRWESMASDGYSWWLARFRWNLVLTDLVRIDHFRGFEACWVIPAEEETAINGQWEKVPGDELFQTLFDCLGDAPIVAEDLGVITPEVEALRDRFGFPGMKILQFAFGSGPQNPYLPHNLQRNCIVYTGTHDNNTTAGWWHDLDTTERNQVLAYLGADGKDIAWQLVRVAMASVAELCICPLQDILSLGGQARMNAPGTSKGNWGWRLQTEMLNGEIEERLATLTNTYGRAPA